MEKEKKKRVAKSGRSLTLMLHIPENTSTHVPHLSWEMDMMFGNEFFSYFSRVRSMCNAVSGAESCIINIRIY